MKAIKQKLTTENPSNGAITEVTDRPVIDSLAKGKLLKTLQIRGHAGTVELPHYSTRKALLVVEEGQAQLHMLESDHILKNGSIFIIGAGKEHLLKIQKEFKAFMIMDVDSKINFT